jgi:hypothetical protein
MPMHLKDSRASISSFHHFGVMAVKNQRFLAFVFPLVCVLLLPAFVSAEGWNLNPWAKKKPAATNSNMFPSQHKTFQSKKEPSTWQKVSSGTAGAWDKTTSTLNPWKKEKKTPARVTGVRRPVTAPKESKSTWYNPTSWFQKEQKPAFSAQKQPASVNEFLNQPRVPY